MTKIISAPLAQVYTGGNGHCEYLVDGDDLQARADAVCDKDWLAAGRQAEIRSRDLRLWGVQFSDGGRVDMVFDSLSAAERYVARCA
ncbi:hypothetical protein [Novosphingobium sp. FKTRR1]|uniref:hypothetical protein n=1 Tax=Novosphingobium sp. FKTRR1 TaxID=2879118 RepID=UPI001CF0CFE7|nr:hypothetical protein [Novosphingobium sp. FKTRR1]